MKYKPNQIIHILKENELWLILDIDPNLLYMYALNQKAIRFAKSNHWEWDLDEANKYLSLNRVITL